MADLATTQRRLWRLLTAPDGVHAALAEAGDPGGESLRDLVRSDARCSAVRRLEVYANAYFYRIQEALAEDYAALAAALGAAGFHDLVTAYLCVHPPSHPSLRHAGAALAGFLDADPAAEPFRRRWPFAADLARLEWALVDAFDAPDAAPLGRTDLADLAPEAWVGLRFALHPSTRVLHLAFPVQRMREAHQARGAEGVREPPGPSPTGVLVWREGERVRFRTLEPDEAELLHLARAGEPFGVLVERLALGLGEADAPARAAALLGAWVDAGVLARERPRVAAPTGTG